jgi:hypothetical protein
VGVQVVHIDFTLNGSSQNIGASLTDAQLVILLGGGATGTTKLANIRAQFSGITPAQISERYIFKSLTIQADPANTHVVYVGGGAQTISSSSYGWIIPLPPSNIPVPPFLYPCQGGVSMRLNDFSVLGTNNEVIHLLLQEW